MKMDKFKLWVAHRLPRWLVHWAVIRMMAEITYRYPLEEAPGILMMDALKRWKSR